MFIFEVVVCLCLRWLCCGSVVDRLVLLLNNLDQVRMLCMFHIIESHSVSMNLLSFL